MAIVVIWPQYGRQRMSSIRVFALSFTYASVRMAVASFSNCLPERRAQTGASGSQQRLSSLSVCQCVCLSVCLSAGVSVCQCVCLSVCLSISVSVYQCVCLSVCLSASVSVCQRVCLPVFVSAKIAHRQCCEHLQYFLRLWAGKLVYFYSRHFIPLLPSDRFDATRVFQIVRH